MSPAFAATLSERPGLFETISYQVTGIIVVFIALGLIWGLLELIGTSFRSGPRATIASDAMVQQRAAPAAVVAAESADGLTPEIVAAIAAAVHVTCGAGARVQAIVPVAGSHDWAQEGRRQIFASHQIR